MNEFEIEDENAQGAEVHQAEETNDAPSENAIEVGDKAVAVVLEKLEDKVIVPVIPDTLNINGVELNIAKLTEEVEQVKLMKIDGIIDEKGYDAAVAKLKSISKLRTSSETWRQGIMKPVLKFQKDLKKKVDDAGALCSTAETYLKSIIDPIDRFKELEREKAELAKTALAEERAGLLVASGMVYNGAGTYNNPLDPAIFVVADELRDFTEEQWNETYNPIKSLFDQEETRKSNEAQQKEQQTNQLASQVADLNEERTEMRREILEARGYKLDAGMPIKYHSNDTGITIYEEQVLNATKDEWKELLNPAPVAPVAPVAEPVKVTDFGVHTPAASPIIDMAVTEPATSIANDFEVEDAITDIEFADAPVEEDTVTAVDFDYSIKLYFTEEKPFIDFNISANYKIRLFNEHLQELALNGVLESQLASSELIEDGSLCYALIKTKED